MSQEYESSPSSPSSPSGAAQGLRLISPQRRDLGGFSVGRILPQAALRHVGPFVFLDQMGPATFPPGAGMDVRPHPHIGLSTVTYLFEGEILHRDSLGVVQPIRPGELNWMTAGRGIVHSERTGPETRAAGHCLFGMQAWVALPQAAEAAEPSFDHFQASEIPVVPFTGGQALVIAGRLGDAESPARSFSPLVYADVSLSPQAQWQPKVSYAEVAVYVLSGSVSIDGQTVGAETLAMLPGPHSRLASAHGARLMLLGGEPMPEHRHLWWNFVSSSPEAIEQAKSDWSAGRFPPVPGESDFIPLPGA